MIDPRKLARAAVTKLSIGICVLGLSPSSWCTGAFWPTVTAEKFHVGFKTLDLTDPARSFDHFPSRTIRVGVWYPAKSGRTSKIMSIRELVLASCASWNGNTETFCLNEYASLVPDEFKEAGVQSLKSTSRAFAGAEPISQRFPLLIVDSGLNAPSYLFFPLCEFLASHGFVVVSLPSFGLGPGKSLPFTTEGIQTKMKDLEVVLDQIAGSIPNIRADRVGLLAWSVGGLSSMLVATTDPRVKGLVSLDSGTQHDYGLALLSSVAHPRWQSDFAYLELAGEKPNRFQVRRDHTIFESLVTSHKFYKSLPGLNHGNLIATGGALVFGDRTTAEGAAFWSGFANVFANVLKFVQKFVR